MDEVEEIEGIGAGGVCAGAPPPETAVHVDLESLRMVLGKRGLLEELDGRVDVQGSEDSGG